MKKIWLVILPTLYCTVNQRVRHSVLFVHHKVLQDEEEEKKTFAVENARNLDFEFITTK
jgi:hypothetical protein